ncbi:MAG TPA: sugar phosphate isomerase/epimerase [Terriglobales bacterium]|nr:sugar phosphate isomerase/epimerase [Terriglobales bacterium]
MANVRWGYAVNQWRNLETDLARKDQMDSAFKVVAVAGFKGLEITDSALGGHTIPGFFGSTHAFMEYIKACGLDCVSSYFSNLDYASPTNPGDHARMEDSAKRLADFLVEIGGSRLVVRPMGPFCREAPVTDDKIKMVAELWSKIGKITNSVGVETSMHIDFLCGIRNGDQIEKLLKWSDAKTVGLALDTAELTIAGIDPVKFYDKHHARVNHVHFKDAIYTDKLDEYKDEKAEIDYWPVPLILAGTKQKVDRWYYEMGTPGGLVDFPALLQSLYEHGYNGWIIAESDQSPHVEESVLLNAWYRKRVLASIEEEAQQLTHAHSA